MEKVAIDLTWVRHNKVGGTESCVRNLLDGLAQTEHKSISFVLLLAKDNADSFEKYKNHFERIVCNTISANQRKRVFWQNFKMGRTLRKSGIKACIEPVYGKPYLGCRGIKFITTIHDLQAMHYPQYFSRFRVAWMKAGWKNAVKSSEKVVAISQYVKDDIVNAYKIPEDKVEVIYDAIELNADGCLGEENLKKYGIDKEKYYYTVSSLFLHKNLKTAVLAVAELKKRNSKAFYPLVVSGIGGRKREELDELIAENGLKNDVVFTNFVKNDERNMLYKNCKAFLFPSIFEGFGMPPLEAMAMGVPVLTTKRTSLEEVTGGLLNYVEDPLNPSEWADMLEGELRLPDKSKVDDLLEKYTPKNIASQYIRLTESVLNEN